MFAVDYDIQSEYYSLDRIESAIEPILSSPDNHDLDVVIEARELNSLLSLDIESLSMSYDPDMDPDEYWEQFVFPDIMDHFDRLEELLA